MVVTQQRALIAYLALRRLRSDWHGKIVLIPGLKDEGCAAGMAAMASGAVALSVEADAESVRRAIQSGCSDFLVKTLDEALRILKNEVRKGTPAGVALLADWEQTDAAMRERGFVADLVWTDSLIAPSDGAAVLLSHATTLAERWNLDAELLREADELRTRWVRAAAGLFPRDLERWYPA